MDREKIEAALKVLDGFPGDARFGGDDWTMWRTNLTVADLRELLELAQGTQWRVPWELPTHSNPVQIETSAGLGVARRLWDGWDGIDAPLSREDVLRWRELPQ